MIKLRQNDKPLKGVLYDWALQFDKDLDYYNGCIFGNHYDAIDGSLRYIRTSQIVNVDEYDGFYIAESINSMYILIWTTSANEH